MKLFGQISSFVVLLGVSTFLGFCGKPAEMGLAVTAGFLGLVFSHLDKFSKFKGGGFEAEMRDKIEAVVEKEVEPDIAVLTPKVEGYGLVGDDPPKVIRSLFSDRYAWRYISGIVQDSGVDRETVFETLNWLEKNGLARSTDGKTGTIWALTAKGRNVFAEYRP